jgi:hypothetical protein
VGERWKTKRGVAVEMSEAVAGLVEEGAESYRSRGAVASELLN